MHKISVYYSYQPTRILLSLEVQNNLTHIAMHDLGSDVRNNLSKSDLKHLNNLPLFTTAM